MKRNVAITGWERNFPYMMNTSTVDVARARLATPKAYLMQGLMW